VRNENDEVDPNPSEWISKQSIEDGCANQDERSCVESVENQYRTQQYYENKSYAGLKKFDYGVSWHGYWNKTLVQLDEEFKSFHMKWKRGKEAVALMTQLED
jgi:hypothetical protein